MHIKNSLIYKLKIFIYSFNVIFSIYAYIYIVSYDISYMIKKITNRTNDLFLKYDGS